MKVVHAIAVALSIAGLTAILSGCASKSGTTSVAGSDEPMTLQQKQQAVEDSDMSPQAKQAEEQAAARAASQPPRIPKHP